MTPLSRIPSLKTCRICKESLPASSFGKDRQAKYGLNALCRSCARSEQNRRRRQRITDDPAKEKRLRKHYYLRGNYGITLEDYEGMRWVQDNKCLVCDQPETSLHNIHGELRDLAVDHDHRTGKVRGLLCHSCNLGLGKLRDDADVLARGARYLRNEWAA